MKKIPAPTCDPMTVFATCVAAIPDASVRRRYTENEGHVADAAKQFTIATATASWIKLPRVSNGNPDQVIAGTLTKGHLEKLYSRYMVGASGPSRVIYDNLLLSSGELCPLCGGIGHVHTLDHYLPKANFPVYAVAPTNLVPCCRDCNLGKGAKIGTVPSEQPLHPYLDEDKFFKDRWIIATAAASNPISVTFSCSPPAAWSPTDQQRVHQHFVTYNLASRFAVQSVAETLQLVDYRMSSLKRLTSDEFREYLNDGASSQRSEVNGWKRTLYTGLANTTWFCEADFSSCWL